MSCNLARLQRAVAPCRGLRISGARVTRKQAICTRSASLGRCTTSWTTHPQVSSSDLVFPSPSRAIASASLHTSVPYFSDEITVKGPTFAESITEGDIRWIKKVGDGIATDELVAEIETDKTAVEVNAPEAGVITEFLVEDGDKVEAQQALFKMKPGAAPAASAAAPAEKKEEPKEEKPKEVEKERKVEVPSQELQTPKPPPVKADAEPIPVTPPPAPPVPERPASTSPAKDYQPPSKPTFDKVGPAFADHSPFGGDRSENRVKMNRMRKRIAMRLKDAQNTYAMLTTFNEIDMSAAMAMRTKHKDAFLKKHNLKLGFMSAFVKAAAYALTDQPIVNAVIDGEDIVYRNYVDISIAVATPRGLVVPVLRNVETMNFADIERTINELGLKARDGKLAIEEMDGGTFTVSNGGVFGSLYGTPIINPPQSAILGMHAIVDRPVAVNGKVEIRPIMTVALTYDHRLVDGREAVTFLRKIKAAVEDPAIILLHL